MSEFDRILRAWSKLPDDVLPHTWKLSPGDPELHLRDSLYQALEDEQAAVAVAGFPTEATRTLALAQRAFGDLRGLLIGRDDQVLDASPNDGEWTLRETLKHTLKVEIRYNIHIVWARTRGEADPIRTPDQMLPEEVDASGSVDDLIEKLSVARAETDKRQADLSDHEMLLPTVWADFDVDVRFRLNRFAGHIAEHTIQCEKTLASLGLVETEAKRIARRISAMRGAHEHLSAADKLKQLDSRHAARLNSLAAVRTA